MLLHQFRDVLEAQFLIKNTLRLNHHDRTHGAESIATRFNHLDLMLKVLGRDLFDQRFFQALAPRCLTSGTSAN